MPAVEFTVGQYLDSHQGNCIGTFRAQCKRLLEVLVLRKSISLCALATAIAIIPESTRAHGPQIQLTADSGQIVTRRMIADEPYSSTLTAETRLYILPAVETSDVWLVKPPTAGTSGPGIAPGYGFVDVASHPFQPGDYSVRFTSGVLKWNGTDFVDAGATQLQVYRAALTATTADGAVSSPLTWSISASSWASGVETHSGLSYRFLADGGTITSELDAGVYVASLQLSHGALTPSEPFYYVLPTGVSPSVTAQAAFAWATREGVAPSEIQAVAAIPEPSSTVIAVGVLGTALGTRSRRRRGATNT